MQKYSSDKKEEGFRERVIEAFGGIGIREISETTGIPYQTLYSYLTGKRDIPNDTLVQLSKATNVSIHWLLTGEGDKYVPEPSPDRTWYEAFFYKGQQLSDPNRRQRIEYLKEMFTAEVERQVKEEEEEKKAKGKK